jgi:hypothetical protein
MPESLNQQHNDELTSPGSVPDVQLDGSSDPSNLVKTEYPADEAELAKLLSLFCRRTRDDYIKVAKISALVEERNSQRKWDDKDNAELSALIAQYASLREESLQSINNRTQILLLGITAIAALIGGSLTIQNPQTSKTIIYAVFSGAIPLVSIFVLLVWSGEAMRAHRVGYFLAADMEARINQKLGRFAMNWESALWSGLLPRDEMFGPSMMSFVVIGILAVASPWFGLVLGGTQNVSQFLLVLAILVPYLFLALTALYLTANLKRLKNNPVASSVFLREPSRNIPPKR